MTAEISDFYVLGGTIPRDSPAYVVRKADEDLLDGLRRGQFCYVLTSRQMGKSSLMVRTAMRLRQEGITCVVLDLTSIGQNLTGEQWYDGLLSRIATQLDLEDPLDDFWMEHKRLGPLQRWMEALKSVVLKQVQGRIVLFVDEIDAVRSLPFSADEFFAAIRECYNRRAEDADYERLTFCLIGVATPSDLITDPRTTPFNIGRRIELSDFTLEEAAALAPNPPAPFPEDLALRGKEGKGEREVVALGRSVASTKGISPPSLRGTSEIREGIADLDCVKRDRFGKGAGGLGRILYWTGGHPYLTQRLCQAVAQAAAQNRKCTIDTKDVDRQCEELFLTPAARERDANLLFVRDRILRGEEDRASLLENYAQVQAGRRVKDDETNPLLSVLRLSGIVRAEGACLRVRNRIYAQVFNRAWIRANRPDAELRRQKMAYQRGLFRAAAVSAVIIMLTSGMGFVAVRQSRLAQQNAQIARAETQKAEAEKNRAEKETETARRNFYAANMSLAQQAWNEKNLGRVRQLLEELKPEPGQADLRGFEWGLLWRRGHFDLPFLPDQVGYVTTDVAFSTEGKVLRSDDGHGDITFWDTLTGKVLPKPADWQTTISTDPMLLLRKSIGTRLDSPAVRQQVALGLKYNGLGVSPDGKMMVTKREEGALTLWDTATMQVVGTLPDGEPPFAFSPDGKRLAVRCYAYGYGIKLYDLTTSREPQILANTEDAGAISADGRLLATVNVTGDAVTLWDTKEFKPVRTLQGAGEPVALSPDGQTLVSVSRGGSGELIFWETATGKVTGHLRAPAYALNAIIFSPDSSTLAIGGYGQEITLLEVATRRKARTFPKALRSAAFSTDGKTLALSEEGKGVRLYETATGKVTGTLADAEAPIAFSPDGAMIATGGAGNAVLLWNAATWQKVQTLKGYRYGIHALTFSPDGKRLAAGDRGEYTVKLWDTTSGREVFTLPGITERTDVSSYSLFFSPDGKRLYSGNQNDTLKVWESVLP